MVLITWDLIRKKTEHHDGLLEDLEEITLHQLNIEKIDTIGRVCPRLKILYLQNNLIGKIENIKRLKSLVYLNLALNNVTSIPLELVQCEKLRKLDLTINFIDVDALASSITSLAQLIHLDELYLTGNPCTTWPSYRLYVVHRLPKLEKLDGVEVLRGERIQAKAAFEGIDAELAELAAAKRLEKGIKEEEKRAAAEAAESKDDDDLAEERERGEVTVESLEARANKSTAYTPESRIEMHREQEEFDRKKAADKAKAMKGDEPEDLWKEAQQKLNEKVVAIDGEELPKQRNLGKWDFTVVEQGSNIIVDISVQRFLDTSLIDIDVHPHWFQVLIKGKNLLLHFPTEVQSTACRVQRLQTNGHLILTCPKVKKVTATTEDHQAPLTAKATGALAPRSDEDDDDEDETPGASNQSTHKNVIDLSTKAASSSAASSTSASSSSTEPRARAFQTHGTSLNAVTSDYRHIARARDGPSGAHMREIAVTRSVTLEQARVEEQQAAAAARAKARGSTEDERAELEKLGLDDSGVPDLE